MVSQLNFYQTEVLINFSLWTYQRGLQNPGNKAIEHHCVSSPDQWLGGEVQSHFDRHALKGCGEEWEGLGYKVTLCALCNTGHQCKSLLGSHHSS